MQLRKSFLIVAVISAGLLAGCTDFQLGSYFAKEAAYSPAPDSAPAIDGPRKSGKPYQVFGKWYYPLKSSDGYREKGIASWYGDDFHGKKTADGERYNMYAYTAAHPTLPLPTWVRVTNLENGRTILVKVNDRGPFVRGRLIDMSYSAAKALGYAKEGTAPVLVEAMPTDGSPLHDNTAPVQLASGNTPTAHLAPASKHEGFTYRVTEEDHKAEQAKAATADDADAEQQATSLVPAYAPEPHNVVPIYVQTGAFGELTNARRQQKKLQALYDNVKIVPASVKGRTLYRVRIGPLATVDRADQVLARLGKNGMNQAVIVVD